MVSRAHALACIDIVLNDALLVVVAVFSMRNWVWVAVKQYAADSGKNASTHQAVSAGADHLRKAGKSYPPPDTEFFRQ